LTAEQPKRCDVKHTILQADDLPIAPLLMDRRCNPDRRARWRGGRRDSDWTNRPPGAWARLGAENRPVMRLRQVLSSLNLIW
jgi:hypothetical protein